MTDSYDVIIIGGGLTGCATAYFLAAGKFDGSVLVVERDPTYAHAPSARSTGGIRQQRKGADMSSSDESHPAIKAGL